MYQGRLDVAASGPSLYDFEAREMSPGLGAFTSNDTVLGSATNPAQLNRYVYAKANPRSFIDPDGHCSMALDADDPCEDRTGWVDGVSEYMGQQASCSYNIDADNPCGGQAPFLDHPVGGTGGIPYDPRPLPLTVGGQEPEPDSQKIGGRRRTETDWTKVAWNVSDAATGTSAALTAAGLGAAIVPPLAPAAPELLVGAAYASRVAVASSAIALTLQCVQGNFDPGICNDGLTHMMQNSQYTFVIAGARLLPGRLQGIPQRQLYRGGPFGNKALNQQDAARVNLWIDKAEHFLNMLDGVKLLVR